MVENVTTYVKEFASTAKPLVIVLDKQNRNTKRAFKFENAWLLEPDASNAVNEKVYLLDLVRICESRLKNVQMVRTSQKTMHSRNKKC